MIVRWVLGATNDIANGNEFESRFNVPQHLTAKQLHSSAWGCAATPGTNPRTNQRLSKQHRFQNAESEAASRRNGLMDAAVPVSENAS